jgi:predicted phage gp36 major capsid-like protein
MLGQETISAGSVQFPIDNSELEGAGWACELDCSGPAAMLRPLGLLEVKADEIRGVICSTQDLLQDASFNVEGWVQRKAARAVRQRSLPPRSSEATGSASRSGFCIRARASPCVTSLQVRPRECLPGRLVALQFELPEEYAARGVHLMNAKTLGLVMTMSDATGRPIWMQTPATDAGGRGGFMIAGKPVRIVTQFPDVAPSSEPILFADLEH